MLFYLPLESYKERYTLQWAAPKTGWLERNWIKKGIEYYRVDPVLRNPHLQEQTPIKTGVVLDPLKRSVFCFEQVTQLLELGNKGMVTNDDVIYFDDFWHPGIEAIAYAFSIWKIKPKIFAFLHAQSVDEFDFTYPMRSWMRFFEKGIAEICDGIFVCGPTLRDLVVFGGIAPKEKVHITGHPFSSEEVLERMLKISTQRRNNIVYSSRWDQEKNPDFFLRVALRTLRERTQSVTFTICTGSEHLRSNNAKLIDLLYDAKQQFPENILILENLTKERYYEELCSSKIQMNTADQDFVAITLLEASVAGCYPVYPYFRSFPETFLYKPGFMYERLDEDSAISLLMDIISREDLWTDEEIQKRNWIHSRFDTSWIRMLNHMGLTQEPVSDPYKE